MPLSVDSTRFVKQVLAFQKKVNLRAETVVRRVALDLFRRIVQKTPVDTGRARASWNISAGQVDPSVAPATAPGTKATSPPRISTTSLATGFDRIFITNNLPYIVSLEEGSSSQAPGPGGIVLVSIEEVKAFIDGVANG